jgi:hypothetical protein
MDVITAMPIFVCPGEAEDWEEDDGDAEAEEDGDADDEEDGDGAGVGLALQPASSPAISKNGIKSFTDFFIPV